MVSDETNYFRWTESITERHYNPIVFGAPLMSGHTSYPTRENPDGMYKFAGFAIWMSLDSEITERETYGLLEWLGDIGGLIDALRYLVGFLLTPLAAYSLKVELLNSVSKSKEQPEKLLRSSTFRQLGS